MSDVIGIARQFDFPAPVGKVEPHGTGIINDTFIVSFDAPPESAHPRFGKRAILQRINANVFPDPHLIMINLETVLEHASKKASTPDSNFILPPIYKTRGGLTSFEDSNGNFWRATGFIENSATFDVLQNIAQAREAGAALGAFHQLLSDISIEKLHDTLPGFHDTPVYLAQFDAAAAQLGSQSIDDGKHEDLRFTNSIELAANRDFCFEKIEQNRSLASLIYNAQPPVPVRVTHGDPKLNNFLFDQVTGKAISIIDLDTIKAGYIHYDLGDCIRSCCNKGGEMPAKLDDAIFELDNFEAILKGYLSTAGGLLDKRDSQLLYDVVRLLPFELGIRFLTDYLNGNRYFKVTAADDNLYRARIQFQLLASIEFQENEVKNIIERSWQEQFS